MRHARLHPAVIAVVAVSVLSACGATVRRTTTSGSPVSAGGLTVRPAIATSASRVSFSFTAPDTAGVHGNTDYFYVLMVSGPRRPGCVGTHSAQAAAVPKGQRAQVMLGPGQLGGNWCSGSYMARVEELARAHCSAEEMCPQYIRVVRVVAAGGFRVAA